MSKDDAVPSHCSGSKVQCHASPISLAHHLLRMQLRSSLIDIITIALLLIELNQSAWVYCARSVRLGRDVVRT